MSGIVVEVFSKPMCVQCDRTYNYLNQNEIPYSSTDVTKDVDALKYIKNDLGYSQAPVVVLKDGEKVVDSWSGLRQDKLVELKKVLSE